VSARRKTGVIDQAARRRLAEGVRHLANGRITNDEFEDQYGRAAAASTDPGVRAVFWQGAWGDVSKLTLYDTSHLRSIRLWIAERR
jgi:hypothetical protein